MSTYDLGDVVTVGVTVKDSAGVAADATTVVATVTLPDATTATPTVAHTGTGLYSVAYTPTMAGQHQIRWVATGTNASGRRV